MRQWFLRWAWQGLYPLVRVPKHQRLLVIGQLGDVDDHHL
jgi:hypothetical protein